MYVLCPGPSETSQAYLLSSVYVRNHRKVLNCSISSGQ